MRSPERLFAHRLALALGRTLGELNATMSGSEFVDWMDYYDQEPFGALRDNWHAAQLTALTYNVHRGRGSVPKSTRDFMYEPPASVAERRDAEFLEKLRSKARAQQRGQQ